MGCRALYLALCCASVAAVAVAAGDAPPHSARSAQPRVRDVFAWSDAALAERAAALDLHTLDDVDVSGPLRAALSPSAPPSQLVEASWLHAAAVADRPLFAREGTSSRGWGGGAWKGGALSLGVRRAPHCAQCCVWARTPRVAAAWRCASQRSCALVRALHGRSQGALDLDVVRPVHLASLFGSNDTLRVYVPAALLRLHVCTFRRACLIGSNRGCCPAVPRLLEAGVDLRACAEVSDYNALVFAADRGHLQVCAAVVRDAAAAAR